MGIVCMSPRRERRQNRGQRYGCSPFSHFIRHTHCLLFANAGRYLEFFPASSRPSGAASERSAPGNGVTPCEKHGRPSINGPCRLLLGARCGRSASGKCGVGLRHGKLCDSHVGKDRLDIAPTCCCPMSEAMALHRLTAGAAAIGVSCLASSRRDLAIARAGRARTSCPIILRTPVGICSTFTSLTYKEPIAAGISCHHISRTVWRAAWLAKCGVCVGLSRRPCWR
jgi:hypothetical protein